MFSSVGRGNVPNREGVAVMPFGEAIIHLEYDHITAPLEIVAHLMLEQNLGSHRRLT